MDNHIKTFLMSVIVTGTMTFGNVPTAALAAGMGGSVQDVNNQYETLSMTMADAGEALNDVKYELEQTRQQIKDLDAEIEETQSGLEEARSVLYERVRSQYRAGTRSFWDVLADCSSFEEIENLIYYSDKMVENDTAMIDDVQQRADTLYRQKSELETLEQSQAEYVDQQEQYQKDFVASQKAQIDYVNSVDDKVMDAVMAQRAADVEEQKEVVKSVIAEQKQEQLVSAEQKQEQVPVETPKITEDAQNVEPQKVTEDVQNVEQQKVVEVVQIAPEPVYKPAEYVQSVTEDTQPVYQEEPQDVVVDDNKVTQDVDDGTDTVVNTGYVDTTDNVTTYTDDTSSDSTYVDTYDNDFSDDYDSSSSSGNNDVRSAVLEAAYSQLGVPYVWGGETPGEALDCSGFTQYCYSQAGIDLPHSAAAQAGMADQTSLDDLQAGDLVFWEGTASGSASGNHVAIYLGDGQIIHANGSEVAVGTLSSTWTSCGSMY